MEVIHSTEMVYKSQRHHVNKNHSKNLETFINSINFTILMFSYWCFRGFRSSGMCHCATGQAVSDFWWFVLHSSSRVISLHSSWTDYPWRRKHYNPSRCQEPSSQEHSTTLCTTQNARNHPPSNTPPHSAPLKMPGTILPATQHHNLHHSNPHPAYSNSDNNSLCYMWRAQLSAWPTINMSI